MRQKQFWLSLGLVFCILFNALPFPAQSKADKTQRVEINLSTVSEPKEVFRAFLQSSRDGVFSQLVKKVGGRSNTEDLENTLNAESVYLFEQMNAASENNLTLVAAKAKQISQKKYEELQKSPPKIQPTTVKRTARRGGPSFDEFFLDFEPENPQTINDLSNNLKLPTKTFAAEGEPVINKTETETGVQITGSASKTTELAEATVTQSESADNKVNFDGKRMTIEHSQIKKTEVISQIENKKVTKTTKLVWGSSFDTCPDANGIVRGNLKANVNVQIVTNEGKEIAALTEERKIEFEVTGYVNEDAEMTHFDMEGDTVDTKTGYDRAKQRDLVQLGDDLFDGSTRIKHKVKNSKPPHEVKDEYGRKKSVDAKYGDLIAFFPVNLKPEYKERLTDVSVAGFQMNMFEFSNLMRSSIYKWQNYECVDVECTAAKNTLSPGENIDVNAVSISKQDLSKFNAKLEGLGSESVTPKDQFGTPKAVYNLTAKSDGTGSITVKSTSRRGIGLGMLEFGKSWQDDDEICDGNWHGTVEIRKSFEETFKKTTKPGEISSNLRMSGSSETINRRRYEGTVKIISPKVVTAGVSLLNAKFDVTAENYNLNHGNFTDPGECGWNKPTVAKVDSGTELNESSFGEGTTDITIGIYENNYSVNAIIPRVNGTYSRRVWHKSEGYCQPGNNRNSDKTENNKTYFDSVSIAFNGTIDPKKPDVLTGTKTITSSDGKETTIITWRLKRCIPGKAKTKSRIKK